MKKVLHIIVCLALLLAGCVEPITPGTGQRIVLNMHCEDPALTKTEQGLDAYNENLITCVDLFFYSGDIKSVPKLNQRAVLYKHFDMESTTTGSAKFPINVSSAQIQNLFPEGISQITVFAVANYMGSDPLVVSETDLPTLNELYNKSVTTEFANSSKISQDMFMMRGFEVLDLNGADGREKDLVCIGTVGLERYACKLTVAVHIPETSLELASDGEIWHPMRESMEVYFMDGVNTVKLSGKDDAPGVSGYFDYSKARRRFAVRNSQTGEVKDLLDPTIVDEGTPQEKKYYNTYPMYMYPQTWVDGSSDKSAGTCEPYIKLILPWYREENVQSNIYANQRQCYYKVMLPDDFHHAFEMNNWYHLNLDIDILGALTDENAVPTSPASCFIVPWQNLAHKISHNVDVGEAHYLFVERDSIVVRNSGEVSIPYLTSHPVQIKNGSIRATRPYYGAEKVNTHLYDGAAVVCQASGHDIYPDGMLYLDYIKDQSIETSSTTVTVQGEEYAAVSVKIKGFEFLVVESLARVIVRHQLENDYTIAEFDYSPYTILFTLEHIDADRIEKMVKLEQYPAVYIDRITNSDAQSEGGTTPVKEKSNSVQNSPSRYWGYAFVDGGAYWPEYATNGEDDSERGVNGSTKCIWKPGRRQYRRDQGKPSNEQDMFFVIQGNDDLAKYSRSEYQWRTVWYTGGSLDLYRINVTELPSGSEFVIGDPRAFLPRDVNKEYKQSFNRRFYDGSGEFKQGVLPEPDPDLRDGFAKAPALYPAGEYRTLMWYYPADTTDRTKNMLAPSIRISSKFSGVEFGGVNNTLNITKEYATYRCAAYQEDGFPAGRWRLPTMGEINFIARLSSNKVITELFTLGQKYWSSTGAILVDKQGNVSPSKVTEALLRCVYDTWYWGDEQQEERNQFVWGDRPR